MEVGVEDAQCGAVVVAHFPCLDVGMVDGDVLAQVEGDAVEARGQAEDALLDAGELEVGAQHLAVDVVALHLQLLAVVGEVPGAEFVVGAFGLAGQGGDFLQFATGGGEVGLQEVVEEVLDVGRVLCHAALEDEVGKGLVAEDVGQLTAQVDDARDEGQVVVVAFVGAEGHVGHVHLLAQLAVVGIGHEGAVTGALQCEDPSLESGLAGCLGCCIALALGQSGELRRVGDVEAEGVGVAEHVLLELQGHLAQFHLQLGEALLVGVAEQGSVAHEGLVHVVEQGGLLGVEWAVVVVYGLDAQPEVGVEHHAVAVLGQDGGHLLCQGVHLVVGVGTDEVEEGVGDLRQGAVALGYDGVLEGGGFGILRDALYVGHVALHAFHHGSFVVLEADLVEGDGVEWGAVGLIEKRVLHENERMRK